MALSLKDPETDKLARKLAFMTGETMTQVITFALRERLDRLEHRYNLVQNDRIQEMLKVFKSRLPNGATSTDHGNLLYGEDGMPL